MEENKQREKWKIARAEGEAIAAGLKAEWKTSEPGDGNVLVVMG